MLGIITVVMWLIFKKFTISKKCHINKLLNSVNLFDVLFLKNCEIENRLM